MQSNVIFLPGLGNQDSYTNQIKLLKRWQKLGLNVHFHPLYWSSSESYESKFKKVLDAIDQLTGSSELCLVGVSAGASMALNAYVARPNKVQKVIFICGKLADPGPVNPRYFVSNPAFRESLNAGNVNLAKLTQNDKTKMLSIRALYDGVVSPRANYIAGVQRKVIFSVGHVFSIFYIMAFHGGTIAKFIREA